MPFQYYDASAYPDLSAIVEWLTAAAAAHPDHARLEVVGTSREGRPIHLLTVGQLDGRELDRPALWVDGGTHAVEWTGVASALYSASKWLEALASGDPATTERFRHHTAFVLPCVSPDGYHAMREGLPFLRSTLRPPRDGVARVGFEPRDIDGDGAVRWMRWRHPAGPFVSDPDVPLFLRPRTLADDPADAFFAAPEGELLDWDGVRWTTAPRRHGVDLNRNFPGEWAPFAMFGMDSGEYSLSEPESRAMVEAFTARRHVALVITNHTYTGCLLTQPYRPDGPVGDRDIAVMEVLANDLVEGTGYKVFRVHPDFTYDPKNRAVGVWSDTLCATFGVAGYTLELWNPYGHAGVEVEKPAAFFRRPDPSIVRALVKKFSEDPGAVTAWRAFDHPQLGAVEIGGIDYLHTIRNPPVALLRAECDRGFAVHDRALQALPRVTATLHAERLDASHHRVRLVVENVGYLPTSSLNRAETIDAGPGCSARLVCDGGEVDLVDGPAGVALHHLDGWGTARVDSARHPVYPALPARGHRATATWVVRGQGAVEVRWHAGRGGRGVVTARVGV